MGKIKYWLIVGFIILFAIFTLLLVTGDSTLSRLKSAGENGDVEAQYALGLMYLYGEILDVDYQQAKIWYEKAADQNDPACAGQTRCDVCKWSRGKSGLSAIKIMV